VSQPRRQLETDIVHNATQPDRSKSFDHDQWWYFSPTSFLKLQWNIGVALHDSRSTVKGNKTQWQCRVYN